MSTKIFNAYLWDGTAPELIEFLKDLRKKYIEAATDHLVQFQKWLEHQEEEYKRNKKYFSLSTYLQDQIIKGINNPDNIEASATVYFRDEMIAVQFFGLELFYKDDKRILDETIKNHPKLSEYSYWNNVDRLEGLTEDEWDERKEFWDFLNVPSEDGLIYEFSNRSAIWEIVPNYEQKIR